MTRTRLRNIFFSLLFSVILCSCDNDMEQISEVPPEGNGSSGINVVLSTRPNTQMASHEGFIYELENRSDHGCLIVTDMANAVRMYLSSDMTVSPDTPESTSYVPAVWGTSVLICFPDRLGILQVSTQSLVRWKGEEALPCLYTMEYSGEDQRKVFELAANQWINTNCGAAADEEYLYIIVNEMRENDLSIRAYLLKISHHTGERQEVCEVDARNPAKIVAAYDSTVVLQVFNLEDPTRFYAEQIETMYYSLYGVDVDTGEKGFIMDIYPFQKSYIPYADSLYILDRDNREICEYDLRNGETVKSLKLPDGYDHYSWGPKVIDNRLVIMCYDDTDSCDVCSLRLDTGETTPLTVYEESEFPYIVEESGESFLMAVGRKPYTSRVYGKGGEPEIVEGDTVDYRIIRKEDYWDNRLDLVEIRDFVTEG